MTNNDLCGATVKEVMNKMNMRWEIVVTITEGCAGTEDGEGRKGTVAGEGNSDGGRDKE